VGLARGLDGFCLQRYKIYGIDVDWASVTLNKYPAMHAIPNSSVLVVDANPEEAVVPLLPARTNGWRI
jgi:hypothetical protein